MKIPLQTRCKNTGAQLHHYPCKKRCSIFNQLITIQNTPFELIIYNNDQRGRFWTPNKTIFSIQRSLPFL